MKSKHTSSFTSKYAIILGILLIFLDQLAKYLIRDKKLSIEIFQPLLKISFKQNFGAAFGMMEGMSWLFIIVAIAVIISLLYYHREFNRAGLTLILAGTIGNLLDRLFFGYVTDYISIWIWPTFNVADAYNVTGAILLIWQLLKK